LQPVRSTSNRRETEITLGFSRIDDEGPPHQAHDFSIDRGSETEPPERPYGLDAARDPEGES
jgi:hypothetical protein